MKSYDEIANSVFERRNEFIIKHKRKKRIIISMVTPVICCCVVLITSFGLWKSGIFSNNIPVIDNSQNVSDNSNNNSSSDNNQNNPTGSSNSSQDNNSSSNPSSNSNSPVIGTNYLIDNIDKINFYSAKKIINDNSLFPIGMNYKNNCIPNIISLSNKYVEYLIDRNKVFTTTMVTYFTIELNDEKGFLAQKLGGTGLVEVVVTKNNIDELGEMITFKRDENYYTCFENGGHYDPDSNKSSIEFSSHKYIKGFNIIKNLEQENYKFTVRYEDSKVIGFECAPFGSSPFEHNVDDVTFIQDFCIVLYTKQTFTIDELEIFFKDENKGETL